MTNSGLRKRSSKRQMIEEGIKKVLEIGPGKVLSGLMKRIDPSVETENLEDLQTLKNIS